MPQAEPVRFYFDPICPWCYQTSRWIRRLAELGLVNVDWAVFSLEMANAGDQEMTAKRHERSECALRTVIAVRERHGRKAVGAFYAQLGQRVHERGEPLDEPATVEAALADADLDPGLSEKVRYEAFAELKRNRLDITDLQSVRQ